MAFWQMRARSVGCTSSSSLLLCCVLLCFNFLSVAKADVSLSLCSSQNTGADSDVSVNTYQSIGLCQTHCDGYAYAILQGKSCWCSNYSPGSTESLSSCDESCPGYPDNKCGSTADDLFGYVLMATPSGTESASSSGSQSTSSSSSSSTSSSTAESSGSESSTSTSVSTSSSSKSLLTSTSSSSSSSSFSSSSVTTSSRSMATSSNSASVFISTFTVTGSVKTVTQSNPLSEQTAAAASGTSANPTSSASSALSSATAAAGSNNKKDSFWDNKGKVGGVFFVVGLASLAIIAGLIFLLLRCWRKRNDSDDANSTNGVSPSAGAFNFFGSSPKTDGSGGGGATGLTRDQSTSTTLATGLGISEKKPSPTFLSNTTLYPVIDQRLDPGAMYMQWEENDSRMSFQDGQDYSRKILRVTNPSDDD